MEIDDKGSTLSRTEEDTAQAETKDFMSNATSWTIGELHAIFCHLKAIHD